MQFLFVVMLSETKVDPLPDLNGKKGRMTKEAGTK